MARPGDEILAADSVYYPTRLLTQNYLKEYNIKTTFYNPHDLNSLSYHVFLTPTGFGSVFLAIFSVARPDFGQYTGLPSHRHAHLASCTGSVYRHYHSACAAPDE